MRTLTLALCTVATLSTASVAQADKIIIIKPEARSAVHDYVIKEKIGPMEIPDEDGVAVGVALPESVELQPLPDEVVTEYPELGSYDYVVVGDRIAVVEPDSRKVVTFIEE